MDILRLKGLNFRGHHGFYREEREKGNNFIVDITFYLSLKEAAKSDNLEDTLDYEKVYDIVESVMNGPSVKLIEHLAFLIGNKIQALVVPNSKFKIAVRKMSPPLPTPTEYSEVILTWPR